MFRKRKNELRVRSVSLPSEQFELNAWIVADFLGGESEGVLAKIVHFGNFDLGGTRPDARKPFPGDLESAQRGGTDETTQLCQTSTFKKDSQDGVTNVTERSRYRIPTNLRRDFRD